MIQHSPAEQYIKYLLLQSYSVEGIKEIILKYRLLWLGEWYIKQLSSKLKPPPEFFPHDRAHKPSQRFLIREGVYHFFNPDHDVQVACEVLEPNKARVKEFIEASILVGAPLPELSRALTYRMKYNITEQGLKFYKSYFFNIDLVDRTELIALYNLQKLDLEANPNAEIARQSKPYGQALSTDPRYLAAQLPPTPQAAQLAQMRLGYMPKALDEVSLLQHLKMAVLAQAYESAVSSDYRASEKILNNINAVEKIEKILEGKGENERDLRAQLRAIQLKTTQKQLPTITQLTNGEFTADVYPTKWEESAGNVEAQPVPEVVADIPTYEEDWDGENDTSF